MNVGHYLIGLAAVGSKRPNILFITCHDLGRFLGCYGISTVRTPNLDRFASEGSQFTNAFATAPQCSPSRASIFTGRYPNANGVLGLTHGEFGWDLLPGERHLAQVLSDAGYHTAMIGILHEARQIDRCGFNEVVLPGHDARETSSRAVEFLEARSKNNEPFYLQLGYHEPHRVSALTQQDESFLGFTGYYLSTGESAEVSVPPYIRDDDGARAEIAELQTAVEHLDAAVGVVLEAVDRSGLRDNTLVIFTTDHGLALPRAKCSLFDPGLEVTLLIRTPGTMALNSGVVPALVSNVDVFATVLELAGVPIHSTVHGRSLGPLLRGETTSHRDSVFGQITYHDYYHPQRSIRTGTNKLILSFTTAPLFMDPTQSWVRRVRPVIPAEPALSYAPAVQLYDLMRDPNEWENLAEDPGHVTLRQTLLNELYTWMQDMHDPLLAGAVTPPRHHQVLAELIHSANE